MNKKRCVFLILFYIVGIVGGLWAISKGIESKPGDKAYGRGSIVARAVGL